MPAITSTFQVQSYSPGAQMSVPKYKNLGVVQLIPIRNFHMGLTPVNINCMPGVWSGAAQGNNPYDFDYNITTPDTALLGTILRMLEEPRTKRVAISLEEEIPERGSFNIPIDFLQIYTNNVVSPSTGKTVDEAAQAPHLIPEKLHRAATGVRGEDKPASLDPTDDGFQVQSHAVGVYISRVPEDDFAYIQLFSPPPLRPVQIVCSPNSGWSGEVTNEGIAPPYSYWYFITTSDVAYFNSILAMLERPGLSATDIEIQGVIPAAPERFDFDVTYFGVGSNTILAQVARALDPIPESFARSCPR